MPGLFGVLNRMHRSIEELVHVIWATALSVDAGDFHAE
jgi:hypothetical protein